jgi:hypothetical protein
VIRSILVANEAFLHNALIDKLGGIYLDLLSPQYFHASTKDRRDVIRSMRYVLRGLNGVDAFATRPARNALLVGAATCVVALLVFGALYFSDFRVVWPIVLAQGGLLGLFTGIGAFVFFRQRMKRVLGPWSRLHPPA